MKTKKKTPSDYPTFGFRVSKENKDKLNKLIAKAEKLINATKTCDDYVVRKNDVIVEALEIGLERLIKKYKK